MTDDIVIEIRFSIPFSLVVSQSGLKLSLDKGEQTVGRMLARLGRIYKGKVDHLLFDKERHGIFPGLMVKVNERVFTGTALNREDFQLKDQDVVDILFYVSGG